jgi:hypothetical protein
MMTKTPKGRNVALPDIAMIPFKHFLWILLPQDYDKVERSSNRVKNHFARVFGGINSQPVCILEIGQMIELTLRLSSQVDWMMAVCLIAGFFLSLVNFPRFVSIPNCPSSICHMKILLESFSKSPLDGIIIDCKLSVLILNRNIIQNEDFGPVPSFNFQES